MANFCLPNDRVNAFLQGIKSGELNPNDLAKLDSQSRRDLLENYVGKDAAKQVNAEFESKLLLKNQQQGMITWAKSVSGIKPQTRRDLVTRIQNMESALTPTEQGQFLSDLAERRLGFNVSEEEAKTITNLSRNVQKYESLKDTSGMFPTEKDRLNYGLSVVNMTDYVSALKNDASKLKFGDILHPSKYLDITSKAAGNLKAVQASLDNSALFRQGWKTLFTNPKLWKNNAVKSWSYIIKEIGGKDAMKAVKADIVSRPNYDRYAKAKLAVFKPEEAFPESAPEKIPGLGRLFKASESAYTGFLYRLRADIFDKYVKQASEMGIDVNNTEQLQAIAKVVNSLTGRANLGKAEPVANYVNNILFSPRFLVSNWNTATAHLTEKGITSFARRKAAENLAKVVAGTATVLATAEMLRPGSVDLDPRSTDFGKIKIGDTRFDVTGGIGSLGVLAARLISGKSKTSSGTIKDLRNPQYGGQDTLGVISQFIRNKLSPVGSLSLDVLSGKDALGNKITPQSEALKSITPISIQNAFEVLQDPNSANNVAAIIADGLGISTNTYGTKQTNSWQNTTSKELTAFKQKVGDQKFQEANTKFSNEYNAFISKIKNNGAYQRLSEDEKQVLLNKKQAQLKSDIFKQYNFTYKIARKNPNRFNSLLNQ